MLVHGRPMAEPTNRDVPVGRREDPRVRVSLAARLDTVTGTQAVRLNNLSRGGASICTDAPLKRGSNVILRWRDLEVFGTVTWVEGARCGLKFDEPLSDDQVLLARSLSDNGAAVQRADLAAAARDFASGALRLATDD